MQRREPQGRVATRSLQTAPRALGRQPRFDAVHTRTKSVEPLIGLLRERTGRLGRGVGRLGRLIDLADLGLKGADAFVHRGDLLVDIFGRSASAETRSGQS